MIVMQLNTWDEFKELVINQKQLKYQFSETSSVFELYACENVFVWQIVLVKNSPEGQDFENNYKSGGNKKLEAPVSVNAFSSKTFNDRKLFKRVHGIKKETLVGTNEIIWTCPYNWSKFIGIEFTGCQIGDYISLYILDANNNVLNQFGFEANLGPDFYTHKSEFDADLFLGLKIQIVYNSISYKTVGINFCLNEVK